MVCYNIRYLAIVAVVLCNCITWTSSWNHYSHNTLRHRSRHRRQGAGLFLSGSYVIPGGEGTGAWGPWGEVSSCSRTCGGGVASQKRICLEVRSDGQPRCTGGDTKYFSCQTQDCPEGSPDFRAQQCSEFDRVPNNGAYYNWVPYTKGPLPCELNCMPRGGRFYYRHKKMVTDGTKCNEESLDVCVNGTCQPVGCDMMLGSNAIEDKCRVCRGNGTNCQSITGKIDSPDLTEGYNDVLLIPKGATSIVISESRPSNNYLAIRSKEDNKYYLNGGYIIDFPRNLMIAGALWQYERTPQHSPAPDRLRCLGPTNQPLYLSLLLLGENVGVDYEYSIPTALAPPPNQEYNWVHEAFSPCSASCGGGYQTRNVTCRSREELKEVEDSLCDAGLKPVTNVTCATHPCPAKWVEGPWSPCTKPCGGGGTRSRQVHCEKIITNSYPSIVEDQECFNILGEKPVLYEECNQKGASCPTWFTGPWKPCDKLCGEGKQTRQVVCHQKINGKVEVYADDQCTEDKPPAEQGCYLHPCEGVDWVVSEWSGCDSCLSIVRTRSVECATYNRKVVNSSLCNYHPAPISEQPCDRTELPPCTVQWYATQWSNCSVECGKGVQTRRVFCGQFDGSVVVKVDDSKCGNETKYQDTKPCEVPDTKCPAKWFFGPWSECNKTCGGGEQSRRVMCLSGGTEAKDCDGDVVLESTQNCNQKPCDKDETIPVDAASTPVMDEDEAEEECSEDEDYDEAGAEEEDSTEAVSTTIEDMMLSDSPSTSFTEEGSGESSPSSFFTSDMTESGSGSDEPTISTIPSSSESSTISSETPNTSESSSTESSSAGTSTESEGSAASKSSGGSTEIATSEDSSTLSSETPNTSESSSTESSSAGTSTESEGSAASKSFGGSTEIASSEGSESTTETSTEMSTDGSTTETIEESTTDASTTELTTEPSTEQSTTDSTTVDQSTTDMSTTDATSTEEGTLSTTEEGGSTTESGTTSETETGSTDGSGTTESGSTEETATTESGSTDSTQTTESGATEETGTTETGSTAETGSTESTSEGSSTTELDGSSTTEFDGSTTTEFDGSSTTEFDGSSTTELDSSSTTDGNDTTPWDWASTVEVYTKKGKCKPRKKKSKCVDGKFGCCPDNRTPATGPFDKGCPNPKTCKESKYGCCPDEVSPAFGPNNKDCPIPPCKETLYGCCESDKKTAAEGNNQEGCPPPPPKCKASKFGCCQDNETAAKGPKRKGCPENEPRKELKSCAESEFGCCHDNKTAAQGERGLGCPCSGTEFGCCPDGVSTAGGPQMEGCLMNCNTSAYGCCADGETPAHGPDGEGCCLLSRFGCCPDNYKTAEGPHLEGCGCLYAYYGCCPDNSTIAKGPNNEGCGCQLSEHGCCPDSHTPASGPKYEGCSCHTYQFGCCPDGSTIAKGPNLQGCHCSQSEHGCCGDGQTAAQGPDYAGCDCASSKNGCCPDGVTQAQGEKFLGCTDIPEDRQASCALSNDRGPCRNFTIRWYYDLQYGGCARFWYGGCKGNGNRFMSQSECEDICVAPAPKDACKLPKVKGGCFDYRPRWYFDTEREQCTQFIYGGCLGNANRFDTRELCQAQCEPERSGDQCKLPIERGSCAGNFSRWGFNSDSGRCEQFIWGGCEGNGNRFGSEAACINRCDPPGALKPACTQPQSVGNCTDKYARWTFSQTENRCVPFYYTGCHGNDNNYQTEQDCSEACPSLYVKETCVLPADVGDCADYRERWYYDTAQKTCRQFYYGGCGGNTNNFVTERECVQRCKAEDVITTTQRPATAAAVQPGSFNEDLCLLERDPGPCTTFVTRWSYEQTEGKCTQFQYGGCGGNRNNFPSQEYCDYYCNPQQDLCQLPMSSGPCEESLMRWFYDAATDSCSQFTYGGCRGNENRFDTREECENLCRTGPRNTTVETTQTPAIDARNNEATQEEIPSECQVPSTLEPCVEVGEVWYLDPYRSECLAHNNPGYGNNCRRRGAYASQEACERACNAFRNIDVCRYPLDPGPCKGSFLKFYYDSSTGQCQQYKYGGCEGGPNRFSTLQECQQTCVRDSDFCSLSPEKGHCRGYFPHWFYDRSRDECVQFVYGGCGGNANRFQSQEECEGRCKSARAPTTPTSVQIPQQQTEAECSTPESLTPCGENSTVYYYDSSRGLCLWAGIGNCRHPNSYRTEEECERRCGAFRGLDVCRAGVDPGPCQSYVAKFYYDPAQGCQQFTYGGCQGGPNRFSTQDECEEICQAASEHGNEVLPDCEAYNTECSTLRCEYGVQRTRTAGGCERCACVRPEVDCAGLQAECATLKCAYGLKRDTGPDGCERCTCIDHPCANTDCPAGERCVADAYRDPRTSEVLYHTNCRTVNKGGSCPSEEVAPGPEHQCRRECNDDADCQGKAKCCVRGCSNLCLSTSSPAPSTPFSTAAPTTPYVPELPQAPRANAQTEPQVLSSEGGKATLRCLFHGNPPPTIMWRRGELTIDGTVGRYRLLSDGALEIVSLFRNDSGVYICIADNGLGTAQQEVNLEVSDPVESSVGISGDKYASITGELGQSLSIRCLAYGFPTPVIAWYRGLTGPMVPYSSSQFEARGNILLIRSLDMETLGEYACQAYNGVGKPALWSVEVQAYRPDGEQSRPYLVERQRFVQVTPKTRPTETPTMPPYVPEVPVYTVPVITRLVAPTTTIATGSELNLPCDVDGYPTPQVYWTKNGNRLSPSVRIQISDARLTISQLSPEDSGLYGCHASNEYGAHTSSVQISVEGVYIPSSCTDNPFFANCKLIVRSKYCHHKYYSKFCCKSCMEAGQLRPEEVLAEPLRYK